MSDPRPTWDEWGLAGAVWVASRADCSRRQVGAVILDGGHRVVATGYNGAPAGEKGCLTASACPRGRSNVAAYDEPGGSSYDIGPGACIALHAEQNAVIRASHRDMLGATMYVTHEPCPGCHRMLRGTPIIRVVWPGGERSMK